MLTRLNRTRPIVDVQPVLGKLARRIGKLTHTKVVVFGHTHKATIETNGGVMDYTQALGSIYLTRRDMNTQRPVVARSNTGFSWAVGKMTKSIFSIGAL